jgi:ribosomal protein S10
MFVIIDIYSKNQTSLKFFTDFLLKNILARKFPITVCTSTTQKPAKKKVFTVLKSPHVNKVAQEQFEFKTYKKRIKCITFQLPLLILILKKVKFSIISDINFKIKFVSDVSSEKKKKKNHFNVNDYCFSKDTLNLIDYFKLLERNGELVLKTKYYV